MVNTATTTKDTSHDHRLLNSFNGGSPNQQSGVMSSERSKEKIKRLSNKRNDT